MHIKAHPKRLPRFLVPRLVVADIIATVYLRPFSWGRHVAVMEYWFLSLAISQLVLFNKHAAFPCKLVLRDGGCLLG